MNSRKIILFLDAKKLLALLQITFFSLSKAFPNYRGRRRKARTFFPQGVVTVAIISSITPADEINSHVDWLEIL